MGHGDGSVRAVGRLLRRLADTPLAPLVGDPDPPTPTVRERMLVRAAFLVGGFVAAIRDAARLAAGTLSTTAPLAAALVLVLLSLYLLAAAILVALTDVPFPPLGLPHLLAALVSIAVLVRAVATRE